MDVINCRNVNDGFIRAMDMLSFDQQDLRESRGGQVVEHEVPVATVFNKPWERVLFEEVRDANPFFHFMEGLWMLAGRNDLAFVQQYNQRMSEYSDDGINLHGAYGHRWVNHFNANQIDIIIKRLIKNPNDRRCVLQMWDVNSDLNRAGVDVPCNTCIYFKIRNNELLMTVSNRSNDVIWGTFGANIVHMSMLHEYMASALDVSIGAYTQVSDSFHAYTKVFEEMHSRLEKADVFDYYSMKHFENPYENRGINYYPMVNQTSMEEWNKDLHKFLERKPFEDMEFEDIFFSHVAVPLQDAWFLHKQGETDDAMSEVQNCIATDWATAGFDWLLRRAK